MNSVQEENSQMQVPGDMGSSSWNPTSSPKQSFSLLGGHELLPRIILGDNPLESGTSSDMGSDGQVRSREGLMGGKFLVPPQLGRNRVDTEKNVNYVVHKLDMTVTPNDQNESKMSDRRSSAKYLTLKLQDKSTMDGFKNNESRNKLGPYP